jgi:hypothetical protein
MSEATKQAPVVSGSQMLAAGLASAGAAIVTSKFGVAGTLLGAALTTMIITGGSAILKAYLESVTGRVRRVPRRFRERRKAERYAESATIPGRPDLRDNFAGRMRAALGWFSHLPPLTRRSILIKSLIAATVAFVIGMGTVYAFERGIGNSLSCGLWGNCPEGATPGIHIGESRGTGTGSSISLGRAKTDGARQDELLDPAGRQVPGSQQDNPLPGGQPGPSESNVEQDSSFFDSDRPVDRETPSEPVVPEPDAEPLPEEQEPPDSPSDGGAIPGGESASPAAGEEAPAQ